MHITLSNMTVLICWLCLRAIAHHSPIFSENERIMGLIFVYFKMENQSLEQQQKFLLSMSEENLIQMDVLRDKIVYGISKITSNTTESQAVLFIGDTGVGKSTLLSYLIGHRLRVQEIGLKPCLVNCSQKEPGSLRIGHDKYSETSVPVRISLNGVAFYDCPGFNDNKSREDEIANSFYYQRLMSLYDHTKLVLVLDESFLTESRAHRLPSLTKKLEGAFGSLEKIKKSTLLIVNKCPADSDMEDLEKQLNKLISTNGMFSDEQQSFFEHIVRNNQLFCFNQPKRKHIGTEIGGEERVNLMMKIDDLEYMGKIQIKHIISDIAKLSIRDYLDVLTIEAEQNLTKLLGIVEKQISTTKTGFYQAKEQIIRLFDMKHRMEEERDFSIFLDFCSQRKIRTDQMEALKAQLEIVSFFSEVYSQSKTSTFYFMISSLILTNLSILLQKLDLLIENQKIEVERKKRKQEMKREEQRIKMLEEINKENMGSSPNASNASKKQKQGQKIEMPANINQPIVIAFHRKLKNAELKLKQVSYGMTQLHNKTSNMKNVLEKRMRNQ